MNPCPASFSSSVLDTLAPAEGQLASYEQWLATCPREVICAIVAHQPERTVSQVSTFTQLARCVDRAYPPTLSSLSAAIVEATEQQRLDGLERSGANTPRTFQLDDVATLIVSRADAASLDDNYRPSMAELRSAFVDLIVAGIAWGNPQAFVLSPHVRHSNLNRLSALCVLADVSIPAAGIPQLLEGLSPEERRVVTTLATSGGYGFSRSLDLEAHTPVPSLLRRGVLELAPPVEGRVRLPNTVRAYANGGHLAPLVYPGYTPHAGGPTLKQVDDACVAAALEVVRVAYDVVTVIEQQPVELVASEQVGVRAANALAKTLGLDFEQLADIIGVLQGADLLTVGVPHPEPDYGRFSFLAVTESSQQWIDSDQAARWGLLARGWLASALSTASLMKTAEEQHQKPKLFAPEHSDPIVVTTKKLLVRVFRHCHQHAETVVTLSLDDIVDVASVLAPGDVPKHPRDAFGNVLREASWLGLVSRHTIDGVEIYAAGSLLLEGVERAAQLFPAPVDYLIAQADHTILAPGPLAPNVQRMLLAFADTESAGVATVFRISPESIARGLERGVSVPEMKTLLETYVVGELPQPLVYALSDAERAHGVLRVGAASCFLRCEDPEMLAHAAQAVPSAELRLLAPTVAISTVAPTMLLDLLRNAGFSPAAESLDGEVVDLSVRRFEISDRHTARPAGQFSPPATIDGQHAPLDPAMVDAIVRRIGVEDTPQWQAVCDAEGQQLSGRDVITVVAAASQAKVPVRVEFEHSRGGLQVLQLDTCRILSGALTGVDSQGLPRRVSIDRVAGILVPADSDLKF